MASQTDIDEENPNVIEELTDVKSNIVAPINNDQIDYRKYVNQMNSLVARKVSLEKELENTDDLIEQTRGIMFYLEDKLKK